MILDIGFQRNFTRILQKLHKITHHSMKNKGSYIFKNLIGATQRKSRQKFEVNPCRIQKSKMQNYIVTYIMYIVIHCYYTCLLCNSKENH